MNGDAEEDEDNTTAEILIAQGDDWPTDYYRGFEEPMEVINQILLESESWDLPIHWADVLSGRKELENLLSCLESIDNSCSAHELFNAIDGCSIQRLWQLRQPHPAVSGLIATASLKSGVCPLK